MSAISTETGLAGRRCVVVGATGGIGREIAERLSLIGAVVHGVGLDATKLSQLSESISCRTHQIDVRDLAAVNALFDSLEHVYAVVIASGVGGVLTEFEESDGAHIRDIIDTNVTGTLNVVHAALPTMLARRSGHIVAIGSIASVYPVASPTYAGSKAAVHQFFRSLAVTIAGRGVRLTEILPGRVDTPLVTRANKSLPAAADYIGHMLHPADVAEAALFALMRPPGVQVTQIEIWPSSQAPAAPRVVRGPFPE